MKTPLTRFGRCPVGHSPRLIPETPLYMRAEGTKDGICGLAPDECKTCLRRKIKQFKLQAAQATDMGRKNRAERERAQALREDLTYLSYRYKKAA